MSEYRDKRDKTRTNPRRSECMETLVRYKNRRGKKTIEKICWNTEAKGINGDKSEKVRTYGDPRKRR